MPRTEVDGVSIAYEIVGDGRPWVLTPGGRFSKDYPGVRELAVALAERGNRVLIWDRPNCGESEVCFRGDSESEMQADILAGLLRALDMAPAVVIGGSGGARVSLLAANRHRDVARNAPLSHREHAGRGINDVPRAVRGSPNGFVGFAIAVIVRRHWDVG